MNWTLARLLHSTHVARFRWVTVAYCWLCQVVGETPWGYLWRWRWEWFTRGTLPTHLQEMHPTRWRCAHCGREAGDVILTPLAVGAHPPIIEYGLLVAFTCADHKAESPDAALRRLVSGVMRGTMQRTSETERPPA